MFEVWRPFSFISFFLSFFLLFHVLLFTRLALNVKNCHVVFEYTKYLNRLSIFKLGMNHNESLLFFEKVWKVITALQDCMKIIFLLVYNRWIILFTYS